MIITLSMIAIYILSCMAIFTKPCKYFQLNSPQFDREQGIFSKLAIDTSIPAQWRLAQRFDDGNFVPDYWPVFVKPEWGQNAAGIQKANSIEALSAIRAEISASSIRYLVQQGAPEKREFEIFSIRHHRDKNHYAVLTITEAVNNTEPNPINSIYNDNTMYVEITDQFDDTQLEQLWELVNQIGQFNISRASLRANSLEQLIAGEFHVIEVNLFLPMPINMLDKRYGVWQIVRMVQRYMMKLALITRVRDKSLPEKPVFCKNMLYNRSSKWANFLRARL